MRDPNPPPCYFFPSRDVIIATKWYDISLGIATRAAGTLAIALTWYVFSFRLAEVGLALRAWLLNGSRAPPQLMSGEQQHGQIPQQDHGTRIARQWYDGLMQLYGRLPRPDNYTTTPPAPPQLLSHEEVIVSIVNAAVEQQHWHTAAAAAACIPPSAACISDDLIVPEQQLLALQNFDIAYDRIWPCFRCGDPSTRRCQWCGMKVCGEHIFRHILCDGLYCAECILSHPPCYFDPRDAAGVRIHWEGHADDGEGHDWFGWS